MTENVKQTDYIVLLHGLARGSRVMNKLKHHLETQGYEVYNDDYQSMSHSIETLADRVYARVLAACPDGARNIHFVTYSMGGIVLRFLIHKYHPANLGRVVMIAPPNQGSEVADFMFQFKWFRKWYGPAAGQIGVGDDSVIRSLGPIDFELGVIAGNRTLDFIFSRFVLPGTNDGKVTVESTKIAGMKDHIIVPATHTFISSKKIVLEEVTYFLQHGEFLKDTKNN